MTSNSWIRTVFSSEIKKMMSYRVDFWVQFPALVVLQIVLAYYLWDAVFETKNIKSLGGYNFQGLMLYYLMVPLMDRILRGTEMRFVSSEIYDGSLSRYLIYPVSFFLYKYVQHLAQSFISFLQFILTIAVFFLIFGKPAGIELSIVTFLMGSVILFFSSIMYFILASIFECVAFWADNVWSLLVMLRLAMFFLGGGMIPLNLFPEWLLYILRFTPFPYVAYFPIRSYFGMIPAADFYQGFAVVIVWILVLGGALRIVWKRGLLEYSGVGM